MRIHSVVLLLLSLCVVIHAQIPSGSDATLQNGNSLEESGSVDCSDPLMATTTQCLNTLRIEPLASSRASSILNARRALSPSGYYSDTEELNRPPSASGQAAEAQYPREPLTEFQKFIAATTGEILPIFGATLFRNVPSTFAPLDKTPVPPDYVIGPGDELRIRIWGHVNINANVRVDRSGNVYLPQVGPVRVAGLPYSALEAHLHDAVSRVYRNFNLTADVGQIRAIQVYVTGQGRRPGVYTVSSLSTLVDTLFSSGGPSVEGSLRGIELRRAGKVIAQFDLYNFLIHGDKSQDVKLLDGDVIFIPPAGPQIALTGSVRKPGIYELRSGETLKEVLGDAGGVTAVAAEARISIERVDQHSAREAMEVAYNSVGMVSPLENGDLIRVYSMTPIYRKTVILRGNTANPGRFAWSPGMRLSNLIPDKESLLTRNYWWKRAQLGLPAPEFQPIAGLENLAQPSANYPVKVPLASPDAMRALRSRAMATQIEDGEEPASGEAAQGQMGQAIGPQAEASQSRGSGNASGTPQLASQRASDSAIASEQTRTSGQADFLQPKTDVRLTAPEIDWDYAVIERMDPKTLKTELIPFDLGRLVLDHDASQDLVLQPGDVVTVFSQADIRVPLAQQTKLVRLEGEFVHAGIYSVRPGETLRTLVERAGGLTPKAYLYGSEFTRASTRALQQQRIDEYVQSIKMSIQRGALELVASPAASQKDMASSSLAAGMERDLLASLREIRATGRIVLEFKPDSSGVSSLSNLPLENGDTFVVPSVPSTVNVVGAVYDQNSFLYTPGQRVGAYLRLAGGPNKNADRKHSFVIRADGEVISYAMSRGPWGNRFDDLRMNPGDTIVVPDKTLKPSLLRGVFDYSQLFSQFALGAAALTVIAP